jgi:hypothetical protein
MNQIFPTCDAELADIKGRDKEIRKVIRKQIKKTLTKILEKSLLEDKYDRNSKLCGVKQEELSLAESTNFYGTLTNSASKKSDLIFNVSVNYVSGSKMVYYTVSDKNLFKSFPAAGTYLGPFVGCKPVFVEVLASVEDFYICKLATQLRYLELLSMKGE